MSGFDIKSGLRCFEVEMITLPIYRCACTDAKETQELIESYDTYNVASLRSRADAEGEGEEEGTRWKETTSKTERARQRVCVCERVKRKDGE